MLFLAGTKVQPRDRQHPWRSRRLECIVEGAYLSKHLTEDTQERRAVLALRVTGFKPLLYQWAADFEPVEEGIESDG